MAEYIFPRISDGQIIGLYKAIVDRNQSERPTAFICDGVSFVFDKDLEYPTRFNEIISVNSFIITNIRYSKNDAPKFDITFTRNERGPFIDKLSVTGQIGFGDQTQAIKILKIIQDFIDLSPPVELIKGEDAFEKTASILNKFNNAAVDVAVFTAKRHEELDQFENSLRVRADDVIAKEREKIETEYALERDRIRVAQDDLQKRIANVDDRENTHVRRQIQDSMTNLPLTIISEGLFRNSSISSITIWLVSIIVAVFLAGCAILTSTKIDGSLKDNALLFLEVTRLLLGVGAGTAFGFGLRQLSARYRQVAQWEHELNRFRLDVARASFLIEGDLEARKVNNEGLPEIMLTAFSRGLFVGEKSEASDDQVGSAIIHLLNRPAALKIGPNGAEVSVDKAALKKAGKDLEGA